MSADEESGNSATNPITMPSVLSTVLTKIIDDSEITASAKRFILEDLYRYYDKKCKDEKKTKFVNASATVIVVSTDNKILIGKRIDKGKWPGFWTVPGGKLEKDDGNPANRDGTIYRIAEMGAVRELYEEAGIESTELENLTLLVSMMLKDGRFIFSFWARAKHKAAEIQLRRGGDLTTLRWITQHQINEYNLVPGLEEELRDVFRGIDRIFLNM